MCESGSAGWLQFSVRQEIPNLKTADYAISQIWSGGELGSLPQPGCCGNNIEEMKAIEKRNPRMKPSMHLGPQSAKGIFDGQENSEGQVKYCRCTFFWTCHAGSRRSASLPRLMSGHAM